MRTNYVLIDFENVVPENLDLLDQEWIKVILFVGKNQSKLPFAVAKGMQKLGARGQYVEMSGSGHNALDFHIAFYIGRLSAIDNKDAYFHIVSKDSGFDPLIAHLKQECIYADRVMKIEDIPALIQARAVAKSPSERIAFAEERLLKPNGSRPRSRKALTSHVAAMFLKALSETDLAVVIDGLFAKGCVRENGKRIEYADENRMCS